MERELDEEIRFHLDMRVADLVRLGMSETDARAEAMRRLGNIDDLRTYSRAMELSTMRRTRLRERLESWRHDLRFAARQIRRAPGFATVVALTLAIGIGATTAIFSVVNGVLLRALPYPGADRIVQLWEVNASGNQTQFADPNFDDLRARNRSLSALAKEQSAPGQTLVVGDQAIRANVGFVTRDFFRVLHVSPLRGRSFTADESREGGPLVALVREHLAVSQFGGVDDALGKTIGLDGHVATIVGVMPETLDYPTGADVWFAGEQEGTLPSRTAHNWKVVARLADGVSLERARADLGGIARSLKAQYGDDTNMMDVAVVPLRDQIVGTTRPALLLLLAASLLLLVIACANVVNLFVARMATRRGEMALRLALGAARGRVVQQCVAESLVPSLVGGALGVALALIGVKLLPRLDPGSLPRLQDVRVNWVVLAVALALSVSVAVVMGLLVAWRASRGDVREAMAESQRTASGAMSHERIRRTLVVAQVALTGVLLVGATLLGRSFVQLLRVDPGFRTDHAVVVDVSLGGEPTTYPSFYDALLARVRALPGVEDAGSVSAMPLGDRGAGDGTFIVMQSANEPMTMDDFVRLSKDTSRTGNAEYRVASAGYFGTMHIPLLRGRLFGDQDDAAAPHVAVISAALAKQRWPNTNPIGRVVEFGNMDGDVHPFTIVGVVGDVREKGLDAQPRPTFYGFYRQRPRVTREMSVVVATTGDAGALTASMRRIVSELRPDVAPRVRTIESIVSSSVANRRFLLTLVTVFGAAALVLATLGVYSVIAYLVSQRKRELSIRLALGARGVDVMRLVLRQGLVLALVGVMLGIVGAVAATRVMAGLLYEVAPTDPESFAAVVVVLAMVALLASYLPARRASRVDSAEVLRGG